MWKEILTVNFLVNKENNATNPALFLYDLPALIGKMKHRSTWMNGDPDTQVLLNTPARHILLTALHQRTSITAFQSNESISFQILEGNMTIHFHKQTVQLGKGQMLTLFENMKYGLYTHEETMLLITTTNCIPHLSEN